jgi:hypothetical protein
MTVRATTDSKFLLKFLLIALVCLGFAAYALYDGLVKYPSWIPSAEVWANLKADESLDDAERDARYKLAAEENGWPSKRQGKTPEDIHQLIIWQYIFIVIGIGIGLPCLIWFLKNRGTWVETTEGGLKSSWGQEVDFDQIKNFDKKKWEKKGIGVLTYETSTGPKKLVLDDLKYARKEMDEIVRLVESKIPREMITNGEPEKIPGETDNEEEPTEAPAGDESN